MKKVIEGKVYNTETANKVAEWDNNLGRNDFKAKEETLYRTKKGNWFLEYWGGAATEYSESYGNMSSEGSGIIVYSENEAMHWLEKREETEAIEKYFSDKIEEA